MITDEINELMAKETGIQYRECPVAFVIRQFEGDDKEAMIRLFESNIVSTKVIEYLATKSFNLKPAMITKHRRRYIGTGCACPVTL